MKKVRGIVCYTMCEAADIYGCSKISLWRKLGRLKGIPYIQPCGAGTQIFFPKEPFDRWIQGG